MRKPKVLYHGVTFGKTRFPSIFSGVSEAIGIVERIEELLALDKVEFAPSFTLEWDGSFKLQEISIVPRKNRKTKKWRVENV